MVGRPIDSFLQLAPRRALRAARILANSLFRDMRQNGYECSQILALANDLERDQRQTIQPLVKYQDEVLIGLKPVRLHRDPVRRRGTDKLVDDLYLVGSKDRIKDRFQAWKASKVGTLIVGAVQPEAVRLMAELAFS